MRSVPAMADLGETEFLCLKFGVYFPRLDERFGGEYGQFGTPSNLEVETWEELGLREGDPVVWSPLCPSWLCDLLNPPSVPLTLFLHLQNEDKMSASLRFE